LEYGVGGIIGERSLNGWKTVGEIGGWLGRFKRWLEMLEEILEVEHGGIHG
jgi:hypothetical protein